MDKESAWSVGDTGDVGLIPGLERSPGVGNGKSTPVFVLEKSHGQGSPVGYSPKGCKELDMSECYACTHCCFLGKSYDFVESCRFSH